MYKIREAQPNEADDIARIHVECWRQCYTYLPDELLRKRDYAHRSAQWRRELSDSRADRLTQVLLDGADIVGFAHARPNDDPDISAAKTEFHACYFLQEYRRTAAGPMMLSSLVRWATMKQVLPFCVWAWRRNPIRYTYSSLGMRPCVQRERSILGVSAPEVGYISEDVASMGARLDQMISRVSFRAGASENRSQTPLRSYPSDLQSGKAR